MMRSHFSVVVALTLLATSARVQADEAPRVPVAATQALPAPEEKSPMVARLYAWVPTLTLSLAGLAAIEDGGKLGSGTWETRAGYGLLVLGLGVAPSGGQIYANQPNHILSRSLLCALSLLLWQAADQEGSKPFETREDGGSGEHFTGVLVMGGLALAASAATLTLAIKDLWDAPDAARRANQKAVNLSLAPILLRSEGTTHWGLGVAGRF